MTNAETPAGSSFAALQDAMRPVRNRLYRTRLVRAATLGVLVGSGIALVFALARRGGLNLGGNAEWLVPVAMSGVAVMASLCRPPRWEAIASDIDARYGLKDRVITAWFLATHRPARGLAKLQIHDAMAHLTQVEPADVYPWRVPRLLGSALALWILALIVGTLSPETTTGEVASTTLSQQDGVNQQISGALEESLLRELKQLADVTRSTRPEFGAVQQLPSQVQQQLDQLRQTGRTPAETLATLSEIQAMIAEASRQLADADSIANLTALTQAFSAVDSLQQVAASLEQRDLAAAAAQMQHVDPVAISPLERETLTAELQSLLEQRAPGQPDELVEAIDALQAGLEQQDDAQTRAAAARLANAFRQQALGLSVQAELDAQLGLLAEAKGVAQSGGTDTRPSDESRSTWGRGRAGDPLVGAATELDSARRRESLTGLLGEGPSDRQLVDAAKTEGSAERPLQPAFRPYEQAAAEVLRREPLPLGYRQTIRRYFRAIRPE